MPDLDARGVDAYFARGGTVSEWWAPDTGPLAFHYDAEVRILEQEVGIDPAWRVLDVGTGAGRFGGACAQRGCRVVGIDRNPDMRARAREAAERRGVADRFDVRDGSATELADVPDGGFDLVLCMELFDHLPDLRAALVAMRRKLAEDGRLLFTYVPSESLYGALGNVYRRLKARTSPEELMISRTYSLSEVRAHLEACDLSLERYFGIGVLCANAQTRLLSENPLLRAATAVARVEAGRFPYYRRPWLARHGAHVVGVARPAS